jgi:hypothetical protein
VLPFSSSYAYHPNLSLLGTSPVEALNPEISADIVQATSKSSSPKANATAHG